MKKSPNVFRNVDGELYDATGAPPEGDTKVSSLKKAKKKAKVVADKWSDSVKMVQYAGKMPGGSLNRANYDD